MVFIIRNRTTNKHFDMAHIARFPIFIPLYIIIWGKSLVLAEVLFRITKKKWKNRVPTQLVHPSHVQESPIYLNNTQKVYGKKDHHYYCKMWKLNKSMDPHDCFLFCVGLRLLIYTLALFLVTNYFGICIRFLTLEAHSFFVCRRNEHKWISCLLFVWFASHSKLNGRRKAKGCFSGIFLICYKITSEDERE